MGLSIVHRQPYGSSSVVLVLEGVLDHSTSGVFYAAIAAEIERVAPPLVIMIDISDVVQVDSVGVGGLVGADRLCRQAGVRLTLCGPPPLIRALLLLEPSAKRLGPATAEELSIRWCTPARLTRRRRRPGSQPAPSRGPGRNATGKRPGRGR